MKKFLSKTKDNNVLWAMWIWNGTITADEIEFQLNKFADNGFKGVAIRVFEDSSPEYLTEEFFDLFELVLKHAKARRLLVRIADDFSMPRNGVYRDSLGRNKSLRMGRLTLVHTSVVEYKEIFKYDIDLLSDYVVLAAKLTESDTLLLDTVRQIDVPATISTVSWKALSGRWRVMVYEKITVKDRYGNYLPNLFNPKAAQAYVQTVLEEFTSRFKKYISSVLVGFVTELPDVIPDQSSVAWDDDLVVKYKSRYKKDLVANLPALFFPVLDSDSKNRSHVYNFLQQSSFERFSDILENWAIKNKLSQWTLVPERSVNGETQSLNNAMTIATSNLASTGIQNIDGTFESYTVSKAIADVNTIEYNRETVGVIGRNSECAADSIDSLKEEIEIFSNINVSEIILDGFFFNLTNENFVKTPFNFCWNHFNTEHIDSLAKYASTVLGLRGSGTKVSSVAVVMPYVSAMADYCPGHTENYNLALKRFNETVSTLRYSNIEFDVISEQILTNSTIGSSGTFSVPTIKGGVKRAYKTIIFPYARLINNSTFVFLEKFAIKKGNIIFVEQAPLGKFDDGQSDAFATRVTRLTKAKNKKVSVLSIPDISDYVMESVTQDVNITVNDVPSTEIVSAVYSSDGYRMLFVRNDSSNKDLYATISIEKSKYVYVLDPVTCNFFILEDISTSDDNVEIGLQFMPGQSYILLLSDTKLPAGVVQERPINNTNFTTEKSYGVVLKNKWDFKPLSLNVLPLSIWRTKIGLSKDSGAFTHYYESYFESEILPNISYLTFLKQFPSTDLEIMLNGSPVYPGYSSEKAEIKVDIDESNIDSILDSEEDSVVPILDPIGENIAKYDLSGSIVKGLNRISIRTLGKSVKPEDLVSPPLICGNFAISKGSKGWRIVEQGASTEMSNWAKIGFPYMSGFGSYSQLFEVPSEYERIVLSVTSVSGPVSIKVNEKEFGNFYWQPISVDITDIVKERRNILEIVVANTPDNILRMTGRDSGITGNVYLNIFQKDNE